MTKKLLVVTHDDAKREDLDEVQRALSKELGVDVVFLTNVKQAILVDTDE